MRPGTDFDVLIVGGGPAGTACATLLAQGGARVGIAEAGDFTRFRIGETLEASAGPILAGLGVPLTNAGDWGLACDGIASVWATPSIERRPSIVNPHGRGWRIHRREFDRTLFQNAGAAGAVLFRNSRVKRVRRRAGRWEFSIIRDGVALSGTAPMVVEATGRTGKSHFASSGSRLWVDRLVGVAILGDSRENSVNTLSASALVEATQYGWWYSVLLPGNQTLAVFFTDGDLLPRGRAKVGTFLKIQLQASDYTRYHCPHLEERLNLHCWKVFDARSGIRRTAVSEGWVAAGDALMALDPLCGRGIVAALSSGIEIGEWLLSGQTDSGIIPSWVAQASVRFNDYLEQRRRIYENAQRWIDSPFWRRRAQRSSMPIN